LEIEVVNRQRARKIPLASWRRFLERLVALAGARRGATGFAVAFVSDRSMRALNRSFRGKDATTDVLSFPAAGAWLGDIAVSIDCARAQAAERGHSLAREVRVLLVHGYLHLNGHDHEIDGGKMMRRQRELLARLEREGGRR
jgi:probable rRNA maturation factor